MKHKYHIIHKHEGGIHVPENIIYLSIEEHTEAPDYYMKRTER